MYPNIYKVLTQRPYFLCLVIILALCVRIILFFCYTKFENYKITIDSDQYHEVAVEISMGNGINLKNGEPSFFRLPAYPLFLGSLYKYLGTNPQKALFVQIVLSVLILPLVFDLSLILFPAQQVVAKSAVILAAFHPGFILFSGLQATESLFIIFFLIFLILFFKAISLNKHSSLFFISGVALGVASLFRALGHYVIFIAILLILITIQTTFYKRLYNSVLLFAGWVIFLGSWIARNYLLTGFIFIHTLTGQHFLRYNAVHILMDIENVGWQGPHKKLFDIRDKIVKEKELIENRKLLEPERDEIALKLAFQVMREHPILTFKHACKQILITCFQPYFFMLVQLPPGTSFNKNTSTWHKFKMYTCCLKKYPIIVIFILWELLFYLFLILGLGYFILFSIKDRSLWKTCVLTFPFIAILLMLTLSYGCARLRFPAEPLFIILASYGFVHRFIHAIS